MNCRSMGADDRSRDIAMAINFVAKSAKLAYPPAFGALAFENGLEYRSVDFKRLNDNNSCILCRNLVRFVREIPEFKSSQQQA